MSEANNIVIVGGGYAGVQSAIDLEKSLLKTNSDYNIILIDRKSHFYHSVAGLRTMVEANFENQIILPYSKLFQSNKNKVIQANVVAIHNNEVVVDENIDNRGGNMKTIPFKYLIIATGSDYPVPAKLESNNKDEAVKNIVDKREAVKKAKKILIIGGGPVGIEIAGELGSVYGKQKEITLVHSGQHLLDDKYPKKLPNNLLKELNALGVKVILGEKIDLSATEIGDGLTPLMLTTNKGNVIESDIQFFAAGTKPNTDLVQNFDETLIEANTRLVKVKPTLQLDGPGYEHIFAVGDITNFKETKLAYRAGMHSAIAVKNILAKIGGNNGNKLEEYKPPSEMIIVTVGKNGGGGYLPMLGGIVIGNMFSRMIKSKSLFVDRYQKLLNISPSSGPSPES
nr:5451_t:CDS:2 [Entrophospora candida]